jgi:hypothetical protein
VRDRAPSSYLAYLPEDITSYTYFRGDSFSVVSDKSVGSAPENSHYFFQRPLSNAKSGHLSRVL